MQLPTVWSWVYTLILAPVEKDHKVEKYVTLTVKRLFFFFPPLKTAYGKNNEMNRIFF